MIVSWQRYCKRRRLKLHDIVQQRGLSYDKLCSFFRNRRVKPPGRTEPEILAIFGPPDKPKPAPHPVPKPAPEPEKKPAPPKPKRPSKFELSIKDTKTRLLEVAQILKLDANEKLTKQKILDVLSTSERVSIKKVATGRRKASKKKN
jgi:hypothetical protein